MRWKQWESRGYSGGDSGEGGGEDGDGTMGQRYSGDSGANSEDWWEQWDSLVGQRRSQWDSGD
eukprot:8769058-Pyramimonas_sp.AAC.1